MICLRCLFTVKNTGTTVHFQLPGTTAIQRHFQKLNGALSNIYSNSGTSSAEGLQSYIGRVNYTAFGKYFLEGNFRVDGSSKFVPGQRFGFFPSVAVGWRFTEENFLKPFLSNFSQQW